MLQEVMTKDSKYVCITDINLNQSNLENIRKHASRHTLRDWRNTSNKEYIPVKLTPSEKQQVIDKKNSILDKENGATAIWNEKINMEDIKHFQKRVSLRIEHKDPDIEIDFHTKVKLANILINADVQHLSNQARWKGYSSLSYSVTGKIDNEDVLICFSFDGDTMLLMITVINKTTPERKVIKRDFFPLSSQLDVNIVSKLNRLKNKHT